MTRRNDGDMNGGVTMPREPMFYGTVPGISGTASFSGSVSNISARYIGKALYYNGGGGQTGRTGETLPLAASVKVVDEVTNTPVPGVSIQFIVYAPDGTLVSARVTQTLSDGVASFSVPLGELPGDYSIIANCGNQCVDGGQTVSMTAKARGKALVCVDCAYHGRISRELENPFRLKVVDMFDGSAVKGSTVTYEFLRFTAPNGNTDSNPRGAAVTQVLNAQSDIYGMSRARLKLGSEEGVYTVRARCDSCLEGTEQIPTGTAHHRTIVIETKEETAGDPTPNQEPCPSGCCPYTPVLRAKAEPHRSGGTFTSAAEENRVDLGGYLLPLCLNQGANITWAVADDSIDHNGGTPAQPQPGFSSFFDVGSGYFPDYPQGRALPLTYKATASYDYNGTPLTASKRIKQDEIDKCRQEYIDWETPPPHDLRNQLFYSPRSKFRLGIAGDFGRYTDCYANIYPTQEAQIAFNLRNAGYLLEINSGYRSPRHNMLTVQSSTSSPHLFGDAVDITPTDTSPAGWQALWEAPEATCPKALEYDKKKTILFCGSDGVMWHGSAFPPGDITDNDILVFSTQKNCIHLGELKH